MKNKLWIIFVFIIIVAIGFGVYFFTKNNSKNSNEYSLSRTSTNEENNTENRVENNNLNKNQTNTINITKNSTGNVQKSEEAISTFSTKIYSKDSNRQNNVSICCNTLNNTIVQNASTFSFCDTLGQATSDKGYQEAEIFDKDGNKIKALGGGKCQVSTTLYNAVLSTPGLVVTERHEHSKSVPYIENGKDAAVSYGGYDLKFRNDTGSDIKIKVENTSDNITITLLKIINQ